MAAAEVIRAVACSPGEVRAIFAAVPLAKVQIGADDFETIMQRGQCFKVLLSGQTVGAYVLKAQGPELWVSAAAGRAGVDLTAAMFGLIEQQAAQFDSIAFQTRRRGLMAKAARHGYIKADSVTMRKKLQ